MAGAVVVIALLLLGMMMVSAGCGSTTTTTTTMAAPGGAPGGAPPTGTPPSGGTPGGTAPGGAGGSPPPPPTGGSFTGKVPAADDPLMGKWHSDQYGQDLEFLPDGTENATDASGSQTFKFLVDGDKLNIQMGGDTGGVLSTTYKIEGDTLSITFADLNETKVYTRVK